MQGGWSLIVDEAGSVRTIMTDWTFSAFHTLEQVSRSLDVLVREAPFMVLAEYRLTVKDVEFYSDRGSPVGRSFDEVYQVRTTEDQMLSGRNVLWSHNESVVLSWLLVSVLGGYSLDPGVDHAAPVLVSINIAKTALTVHNWLCDEVFTRLMTRGVSVEDARARVLRIRVMTGELCKTDAWCKEFVQAPNLRAADCDVLIYTSCMVSILLFELGSCM